MTWNLSTAAAALYVLVMAGWLVGVIAAWTDLLWEQATAVAAIIVALIVAVVALLSMRSRLTTRQMPPPAMTIGVQVDVRPVDVRPDRTGAPLSGAAPRSG